MKYYKIDEKKIINTANEIPVEMLDKKGLLPYKRKTINVYDDEIKPDNYSEEINGEWVDFIYKILHRETLDEVKVKKLKEIKQIYKQITNEGFECSNGIKLDCRESDKINWLTLKLLGGSGTIKDFDNVVHSDLEPSEVMTMLNELEIYYKKILSDKWTLETMIDTTTTIEEVNEIYWRKAVYKDEEQMEFDHWDYNPVVM